MKKLLTFTLALALVLVAEAAILRPSAEFTFQAAGNKNTTLRSLRGQSVVLLIADSRDRRAFKKQIGNLEDIYQQFASKQVVFVAALKNGDGPIKSDIPFVVANNGPAVAAAYGVTDDFAIVVIGKDGNVDYQTGKVCTGERVRDVVQNSFEVQASARK